MEEEFQELQIEKTKIEIRNVQEIKDGFLSIEVKGLYGDDFCQYIFDPKTEQNEELLELLKTAEITPYVVEPTDEEVKNAIVIAVQELLDSTAQSRGYDNGFTCASYYNSSVSTFRDEAHAYVEWRDKVWQTCYALLDSYLAGDIPRPTVEDVMSKLPVISWVTDNMTEGTNEILKL